MIFGLIYTAWERNIFQIIRLFVAQNCKQCIWKEGGRRRKHIKTAWSTVSQHCNHSARLLYITSQSPGCQMLNYAFRPMLLSRASYPECIFRTNGLSGRWVPHLQHISAMFDLSTALFLSQEDRKWLGLHRMVCSFTTQAIHITPSGIQGTVATRRHFR